MAVNEQCRNILWQKWHLFAFVSDFPCCMGVMAMTGLLGAGGPSWQEAHLSRQLAAFSCSWHRLKASQNAWALLLSLSFLAGFMSHSFGPLFRGIDLCSICSLPLSSISNIQSLSKRTWYRMQNCNGNSKRQEGVGKSASRFHFWVLCYSN